MKIVSIIISTLFGIGYFPKFPGTVSSAVVAIVIFLGWPEQLTTQSIITGFILIIGIITSNYATVYFRQSDPKQVVIDEASGMAFSVLFISPDPTIILSAFLIFRFFDITKLFGIRRLERFSGGYGVMLDDVLAGVYTNICLRFIIYFL